MSLKKNQVFIAGAITIMLSSFACTKASDTTSPLLAKPQSVTANDAANEASNDLSLNLYTPGAALHSSDVTSYTLYLEDGSTTTLALLSPEVELQEILQPRLQELSLITRSVVSTDNRLELYAGSDLVMVLGFVDQTATVIWTRSNFSADAITYVSDIADQNKLLSVVSYTFKACMTPVIVLQQDQDQGKEEAKEPVAVEPLCTTVRALLALSEVIAEKPVQEQKEEIEQK